MPMNTLMIFLMGAMAVAFALWVFLMFRTLVALKAVSDQRRSEEKAGYFRSNAIVLGVFRDFFIKPEFRQQKWALAVATAFLFGTIFCQMAVVSGSG